MAVATVACGSDGPASLDIGAIEREVPGVLLPGHPGLVVDVDCGTPDPAGLGALSCTAVVAGMEIPVIVHRPAVDGRVRVESPVDLVSAGDLAGRAAERLSVETGVDAQVSCTPAARVAFAGEAFACTATDPDGREIALVATLVDDVGGFRLDADPSRPAGG